MEEIVKLPYHKIRKLVKKKEFTMFELVSFFLDKILHEKFNAFVEKTVNSALTSSIYSDSLFRKHCPRKLEGLSLAVKDNFCTRGIRTTACSKILQPFIPSYESTITSKMLYNGAIIIGKTNMDEFGMGSLNVNSYFGNVINCYRNDKFLVSGGSSGGSAVAVAANLCSGAIGSDTGGSIRLPAAFTGVVGVKPTYGRCSRFGMISFSSSCDQAGILAKDVTDAASFLEVICGVDGKDSTTSDVDIPSFLPRSINNLKGKKVAILMEFSKEQVDNCITDAVNLCAQIFIDEGAIIVEKSLPNLEYSLPCYYIITSSEMSSNLLRYDGIRYGTRVVNKNDDFESMVTRTRSICFGKEVKSRILSGTYALSSRNTHDYFRKAQKVRRLIYNDLLNLFNDVDIILSPASKSTTFPISKLHDSSEVYNNDVFTAPFSLAGLPSISVPVAYSKQGLPIGVQIVTKPFDEVTMFMAAKILEINTCKD